MFVSTAAMETLNNFILIDQILESVISQTEFLDFISSKIEFIISEIEKKDNSEKYFKYGQRTFQLDISFSLFCLSLTSTNRNSQSIQKKLKSRLNLTKMKKTLKTWKDTEFASKISAKIDFLIQNCN